MFLLGSSSPSRLLLLKQANFIPDLVEGADIDETPLKREKPIDYVKRIAESKAEHLHKKHFGNVILCADTIVCCRSKIYQKAYTDDDVRQFLNDFSGKSIKLITAVYAITSDHKRIKKLSETSVKFKHLNEGDINEYIKSKDGLRKAGGIAIESMLESLVIRISGNYSNIMGLPLYDVRNILISAGIKPKQPIQKII